MDKKIIIEELEKIERSMNIIKEKLYLRKDGKQIGNMLKNSVIEINENFSIDANALTQQILEKQISEEDKITIESIVKKIYNSDVDVIFLENWKFDKKGERTQKHTNIYKEISNAKHEYRKYTMRTTKPINSIPSLSLIHI